MTTPSPDVHGFPFRISIREAGTVLPVAGRAAVPLRVDMTLEVRLSGPFTGDPADIAGTVDYARLARHVLDELPRQGPFADADAIAQVLAAYALGLDPRVLAVQVTVMEATHPTDRTTPEREIVHG